MLKFALEVFLMQILFQTDHSVKDFKIQNTNLFPEAPDSCPFKDCLAKIKPRKHGYYKRFFISKSFSGRLFIRRYLCSVCGRTISFLPVFCIPRFQYSGKDILNMLYRIYHFGISISGLIKEFKDIIPLITRRHLNYYKKRIGDNRALIQYALNIMSPEFILTGSIPETPLWIKVFLEKVKKLQPLAFLKSFFDITGKTFLISQNIIA